MTLYSQKDPRWANKIIGFGSSTDTFKNVGCVVCDITYVYNKLTNQDITPDEINKRLKAVPKQKNGYKAFIGALVYWPNIQVALPELKFSYRDYNYNNILVWSWINIWPRVPVLAEVYEMKSPTKRHWITLIGDQKLYNPLTGKIQSTSIYNTWMGSARFNKG